MEGAILYTESNKDLALILQLAKKLGISARKLTKNEIEDYGLSMAISEGRTGEYIQNGHLQVFPKVDKESRTNR